MLIYPGDLDLIWGTAHHRFDHSLRASALFVDGLVIQDGALWCWGPIFKSVAKHTGKHEDHPLLRGMREGIIRLGLRGGSDLIGRYNSTAIGSGHQVVPIDIGEPVVLRIADALEHGSKTIGTVPVKAFSGIVDDLAGALLDDFFLNREDSADVAGRLFGALKTATGLSSEDHVAVEGFIREVLGEVFELCLQWANNGSFDSESHGTTYFRRGTIEGVVSRRLCELRLLPNNDPTEPVPRLYEQLKKKAGDDARILAGLVILRVISFYYQRFQANHFGAAVRLFDPTDPGNDAAHLAVHGFLKEQNDAADVTPIIKQTPTQRKVLQIVNPKLDWNTVLQVRKRSEFKDFMEMIDEVTTDSIAMEDKEVSRRAKTYLNYLEKLTIIPSAEEVKKLCVRTERLPYGLKVRILGIITYLPPFVGVSVGAVTGNPVKGMLALLGTHYGSDILFHHEFERARAKIVSEASLFDAVSTQIADDAVE